MKEDRIPKIIHYVWVGGPEKPKDIQRCLASWKKHLKGYEIKEWNESNFDINSHPFVKAAYEAKKWAYVSDYIRLKAIYNEGGIYLDTDVIVFENFDKYLKNRAFVGYENDKNLSAAVFGAEKNHPFLKSMIKHYDELKNYSFGFNDNNSIVISEVLKNEFGFDENKKEQELKEGIMVYDDKTFCAPSKTSTSIHIFTGTWLENKKSFKYKLVKFIKLRINNRWKANLYNKFVSKR